MGLGHVLVLPPWQQKAWISLDGKLVRSIQWWHHMIDIFPPAFLCAGSKRCGCRWWLPLLFLLHPLLLHLAPLRPDVPQPEAGILPHLQCGHGHGGTAYWHVRRKR